MCVCLSLNSYSDLTAPKILIYPLRRFDAFGPASTKTPMRTHMKLLKDHVRCELAIFQLVLKSFKS